GQILEAGRQLLDRTADAAGQKRKESERREPDRDRQQSISVDEPAPPIPRLPIVNRFAGVRYLFVQPLHGDLEPGGIAPHLRPAADQVLEAVSFRPSQNEAFPLTAFPKLPHGWLVQLILLSGDPAGCRVAL